MRKFFMNSGWLPVWVFFAAFNLIDSFIGESYSNENLFAHVSLCFFILVIWLDNITQMLERKIAGAINIHVEGTISEDDVQVALQKIINEKRFKG